MNLLRAVAPAALLVFAAGCSCGVRPGDQDAGSKPDGGSGQGTDAGSDGGTDAGTCSAGVTCTPSGVCQGTGTTACDGGSAVCVSGGVASPGTSCGSNLYCDGDGGCIICAKDDTCTPTDVCHVGITACSTGVPICGDTSVNVSPGTGCGASHVCSPSGVCINCDAGSSCIPANTECRAAVVLCSTGASVCTDIGAGPNGVGCDGGTCFGGSCRSPLVIAAPVNLSTEMLTARTCPEAPAFPVLSLGPSSATLDATPDAGCLAAGDKVLLINLQGTVDDTANIGRYELMTVATVSSSIVTFVGARTVPLGNGDGGQTDLSTDAGQKVTLFRVPEFGDVVITDAGSVTANPFDGFKGGVVAFRAASLAVHGTISAAGLGYREGDWSQDDQDCTQSLDTGSGESITGPSIHGTNAQAGGAGGLGAASINFNSNGPLNASAGHRDAGEPGGNANGRVVGPPGEAYGEPTGARLTMGSGASGNLTCTTAFSGAPRYVNFGNFAGGIVYVTVEQLTVGSTGSITATATPPGRSTAAAGGYVLLRGRQLDLGTLQVTADGVTAINLPLAGFNRSSAGYVALQSVNAVTGTTSPPATVTTITSP